MTTQDICNIKVNRLAAPDCALLLWATFPTLLDAIRVGQAWGFEYKTLGFIWIKRTSTGQHWHTGMGYWTRANAEPCLLFTRGDIKRVSKSVRQLIDTYSEPMPLFEEVLVDRIGRHSQKPELFYHRVEQLLGDVPRVELFGRRRRKGWDVMGNEVDGCDICQVLGMVA